MTKRKIRSMLVILKRWIPQLTEAGAYQSATGLERAVEELEESLEHWALYAVSTQRTKKNRKSVKTE